MVITKLLLFGAILYSIKFLLKMALIKVFKVEKEPYHKEFVNKKHKIINMIGAVIIIQILLLLFYLLKIGIISQMLLLGICLFLGAIPSIVEAYFWWKDDNKSRYFVLCVGEALFFIIVGITVWQFGRNMGTVLAFHF